MLFPRVQRLRAGSRLWRVRAGALGGSHAENDYRGLLGRIGGTSLAGTSGACPFAVGTGWAAACGEADRAPERCHLLRRPPGWRPPPAGPLPSVLAVSARAVSRSSIRSSRSWLTAAVSRRDWVSPTRASRPRRGGTVRAGEQQAQPEQAECPDHDAVQEQRAGGAGHVVAEHREVVGESMPAAAVGQDAGHAGDHRRDQDDEPDNYDLDALRGSGLLTAAGGPWARRRAGTSVRFAEAPCWRCSAVRGPAGTAGPPADQVEDEQQDGCAGDGGEPGGQVEEPVQGVDVEQFGGGTRRHCWSASGLLLQPDHPFKVLAGWSGCPGGRLRPGPGRDRLRAHCGLAWVLPCLRR